jgi:cleavage and polyadenylation specificity factor subunit 1
VDEETDATAKAVCASFKDPYVVIVKDDRSIVLLKTDKKGELDEEDLGPHLVSNQYISASLYSDSQGIFTTRRNSQGTSVETEATCVLALLSSKGALSIYSLSDLNTRLFHYEGVQFLPSILSHSTPLPRHWKNAEALSEVLIADLGDGNDTHAYLLFRTNSGDVVIYDPFTFTAESSSQSSPPAIGFRRNMLRRIANTVSEELSDSDDDDARKNPRPMQTALINGLAVVLIPGRSPAMVAKVATSSPRAYKFSTGPILAFTSHNTAWCSQGFAYIDQHDNLSVARLPPDISIGHSEWASRKVELGFDVSGVAYLERRQSYVLAASDLADFQLPQDDEWHADWKNEEATCLPQLEQGSVRLLSSSTFKAIDSFQLDYAERAMCIKAMNLEVSEETHERKDLIVVGTAITKGEDMVARGAIYIFDIVDVVPQPGVPETDLKLKLLAKEEVKGAVTSLCRIGSQGFLLAAQGQKCMVRGLKEDLSILPVAFMDMKYYVNVVKELAGTGLCILGDAMNGLWFVGYSVSLADTVPSFPTDNDVGRTLQAAAPWP